MVQIERAVVGIGTSRNLDAFALIDGDFDTIYQGSLDAVANTPVGRDFAKIGGVLTVTGLETRDNAGGRFRTLADNSPKYRKKGKVDLGKKIGDKTPELGAEDFSKFRQVPGGLWLPTGYKTEHLQDLNLAACFEVTTYIEALEELGGARTEASRVSITRRLNALPGLEGKFSFGEGDQDGTLYLNNLPLATASGEANNIAVRLEGGAYHPETREAMSNVHGTLSIGLNHDGGPAILVWNPKAYLSLDNMYSPLSSELVDEQGRSPSLIVCSDEQLGKIDQTVLRAEAEGLRYDRGVDICTTVTTQTPAAGLGHNYSFERGMAIESSIAPDQIGSFLRKYDVNDRLREI